MADHPIIFSAPMVVALLDGRKTMTRRMAWGDEYDWTPNDPTRGGTHVDVDRMKARKVTPWQRVQSGDRLWVRESAAFVHDEDTREATKVEGFAADGFKIAPALIDFNVRFRPSIHMPRWASRLTLIVTATKIERLQEITEADAVEEGIACKKCKGRIPVNRHIFRNLWNSLHGEGAWDANPEVVALTFTVHKQNIDALTKVAA